MPRVSCRRRARTPITTSGRLPSHLCPAPQPTSSASALPNHDGGKASMQMHPKSSATKGASSTSRTHTASASASAHDEILMGPPPPAPHGLVEDVQYEPGQTNEIRLPPPRPSPSPPHHERLTLAEDVKDKLRLMLPDTASGRSTASTHSSTHTAAPKPTMSASPKWCKTTTTAADRINPFHYLVDNRIFILLQIV
ncbi:hypothetical protein DFH06DRAFT_1376442 [Mycena polygramma]|nr:hypothetical protein DFH06DRAFT_1376442 [Mycena polygramma]